ncbi:response regulator [Ancylobacter sp. WKF20]|uniref:GAF domain-containing hybrid sensor histidine kinase/response regulator n=1 Tax=Ancylobacter sp. WKF20 TaxID=3039801 RepID=UPI0024341221|nr:ATP-binding protein [Ancylobacter sp. WKF20]WGD31365.1 response regulator [Ancylobacter sp. WKF20]
MNSASVPSVAEVVAALEASDAPLGPARHWPPLLARMFDMMMGSPIQIVVFWGPDYLALYNDPYAPTIGTKHPRAFGRPASESWSELWDDLKPLLDKVWHTGEPVYARDRPFVIERHGYLEDVNFDIAYSPIREGDGRIVGLICIVNETTDRVRAEQQLRENEARLGFLDSVGREMATISDANAIMAIAARRLGERLGAVSCSYADVDPDADGVTVRGEWTAPGAQSVVGRYRLSSIGPRIARELLAGRPAIVRDAATEDNRETARVLKEFGIVASASMPLVKDGALTAMMSVNHSAPHDWTPGEIILFSEVSERSWAHIERVRAEERAREEAERARLAITAAAIGTWDYQPDADLLRWDARCKELFGLPADADVSYAGAFLAGLHPEDRERAAAAVERALTEGADYNIEFRTIGLTDGKERWLAATGSRLQIEDHPLRFMGTVIDITHRKRVEAELQALNTTLERRVMEEVEERSKAEERLRQAQKMEAVGQLTGGIAHDFNNMLAVIISGLGLMQRKLAKGDTDVGRFVDAALDGAQRAATLTQRLLAFSRQQPLSPKPVEVNRLVTGMSDLLIRTLGETIRVETVIGAGLWRTKVDPAQLESAILNLAVNARDAMPEGGTLTVETTNAYVDDIYARDSGLTVGQYVLIAVTDTGMGMDETTIARAFDPFFTTKPVGKGTGLGLSQVYGFVRQSGGHVRIYSELGVGTSIKIYLPRMRGSEPEERERESDAAGRGVPGETVLVVEDDARVRNLSCEVLRDIGYTVIEAPGPLEALEIIRNGPCPTLLFTDVVMPGMSGRQLVDEVRRLYPRVKVLYTTGYTRNAIVHNGVLDAGTHLLPKPFNIEALATKVREILDE